MERTPDNFSIDDLVARLRHLRPRDRMFRIYAHSPNLFELLLVLEDALSVGCDDAGDSVPDDLTWKRLLNSIQSLNEPGSTPERMTKVAFYIGQIALLLDAIETRDAYANTPGLVRFFA